MPFNVQLKNCYMYNQNTENDIRTFGPLIRRSVRSKQALVETMSVRPSVPPLFYPYGNKRSDFHKFSVVVACKMLMSKH